MKIEENTGVSVPHRRLMSFGLMSLALLLYANASDAFAQGREEKWPDRPVHFIVPFPAGSATDTVARIVAQKLSVEFGQPFVIDNRPGASGELGTSMVAHATPDGYTIGLATSSTHTISASLNPKLSYNPVTDFAHVSMIGASPYVLAVYTGLPANNVAELIALAKSKPRTLNFASVGPESLAHIAGTLFSHIAGVELTEVPYRSSNQAILDLTEGRIEIQFGTLAPTLGQIRSNNVRPLAITGTHRSDLLPDVPTLQESGLKDYDVELWMAVVMPSATPPAIVARLNCAMRDALAMKEVVEALKVQGMEANSTTPEALRERIRAEIEKWTALASSGGLKVER
jgi:tripartite-type tricarboxylate transporter receptor subunit TctC